MVGQSEEREIALFWVWLSFLKTRVSIPASEHPIHNSLISVMKAGKRQISQSGCFTSFNDSSWMAYCSFRPGGKASLRSFSASSVSRDATTRSTSLGRAALRGNHAIVEILLRSMPLPSVLDGIVRDIEQIVEANVLVLHGFGSVFSILHQVESDVLVGELE